MRAMKYAVGFRSTGSFELGFAYQGETLSQWYGTGDELFDRWWRLEGDAGSSLRRVIDEFRPDVIHSHNLPDRLTVLALEIVDGRVPVVHDSHDLQSLRQTPYEDGFPEPDDPLLLEKQAVDGCSALVAVSEEMLAAIAVRHGLPERTLTFANYALGRDLPAQLPPPERPRQGPLRLVYEGTLSTNGGHYDLQELFISVVSQGFELDIYPSRPAPEYHALAEAWAGMRCLDMLPPAELLQVLPRYDFGWAGFNASLNRPHLDTALPNKVFEYLGCGLPVLTLDHKALCRFLDEYGVGVSLRTVEDLGSQMRRLEADLVELRRRVAAARGQLTVEANIGRITSLYDDLVAA
jgi:glycosyltransferase involved in cell wall biosynthesis